MLPTFWFVLKRKTPKGLKIWGMICLHQHMVDLFSICLCMHQQTYCVMFLTFCPGQKVGLTKLFSGSSTVFSLMASSLSSSSVKTRMKQHCTSQWFNSPTVIQHSHTAVPYQLMGEYSIWWFFYSFYQSNLRLLLTFQYEAVPQIQPQWKKALM